MKTSILILLTILITLSGTSFGQLSNGLIAHFDFENQLNDQSLSNIQATNNGCTYGDDRNNTPSSALVLGGTNYVSFNNNDVKVDLPITISAWVKVNSFSTVNVLFRSDNVFEDNYGYWINTGLNTGHISVSIGGGLGGANSSNRRTFKTDITLQEGVWTHLVCVIRDYNDMNVYFDCEKSTGEYTGTGAENIVYSTSESRIGSDIGNNLGPNGSYFDGMIDQLAIWERELLQNEIRSLCIKENYLDLKKESLGLSFSVYPNPVVDLLHVQLENNQNIEGRILDNLGKEVLSFESKNVEYFNVNTSHLTKGVYTVVLKSKNGLTSRKFVKL